MNNSKNIMWGIVLVVIGIVIGTNNLGITNIDIFFDGWWTLFIIVPCFIGLFSNEDKMGNIIGLLIGVILLLGVNDVIDFDKIWSLMATGVIIIIGLSLIFKDIVNSKINKKISELNKEKNNSDNYFAAFSGQDINLSNKPFKGCDVTACFGGIKIDMREAKIEDEVIINASSIFGGITILVPEEYNVEIKSTSIFGGVTNKKKNKDTNKKTIYINALSMFGGVDIK